MTGVMINLNNYIAIIIASHCQDHPHYNDYPHHHHCHHFVDNYYHYIKVLTYEMGILVWDPEGEIIVAPKKEKNLGFQQELSVSR